MDKLRIGEFVALTGSTRKTVNYYHRIGLLPEPERSAGGYRLYGLAELERMRVIRHLKSLGLDLQGIKRVIGDSGSPHTARETLLSLRRELRAEIRALEERAARIDALLEDEDLVLDRDVLDPPSFRMVAEILGPEQMGEYSRTCPQVYHQHRQLYGILDDFQWGGDYQQGFRALAEYFRQDPAKYQLALGLGARLAALSQLDEDDPEVEALARESAHLVRSMPPVRELMCSQADMKKPLDEVYREMVAGVLSPAQLKYQRLFKQYLSEGEQEPGPTAVRG
ncbi:MAG: MerR family transcriptional regulator [Syntrophomonadaceae bacterium]|jgi:DNA-binding transcriptional MerR regulator|nr:MerR family transcriptional regulator [Syntrophomonadaceae bacterium]